MPNAGSARTPRGRRRRFWFDPRFAIGLVLIVASVVGVAAIVTTADDSVLVYAARSPLAAGDRVDASDLEARNVRLDGAEHLYLTSDDLDTGVVVTRTVAAGELVPASAVGSTVGIRQSSVVLTLTGQLPASVAAGSTVDVWASRETESGVYGAPTVLVSGASVVRLVESDGIVVDDRASAIEVLVPRNRIARVLEALANDDVLSAVPTSLPAKD